MNVCPSFLFWHKYQINWNDFVQEHSTVMNIGHHGFLQCRGPDTLIVFMSARCLVASVKNKICCGNEIKINTYETQY